MVVTAQQALYYWHVALLRRTLFQNQKRRLTVPPPKEGESRFSQGGGKGAGLIVLEYDHEIFWKNMGSGQSKSFSIRYISRLVYRNLVQAK